MISRTVGVSVSADEELGRLSRRLDLAYRETAVRVPSNSAVTIVRSSAGADLSVERLIRSTNRRASSRSAQRSMRDCPGSICLN